MQDMEYAKGWKPDEGDVLIGVITNVDAGWSDYRNGNYPILTIQPDTDDAGNKPDPVAVHCFHTALYNRVMSIQPRRGERIGVQYKGKRPSKQNPRNTVAVYVLRVDRKDDNPYARMQPGTPPQGRPPESDVPADVDDFNVDDFKPTVDADTPDDTDDIPF